MSDVVGRVGVGASLDYPVHHDGIDRLGQGGQFVQGIHRINVTVG